MLARALLITLFSALIGACASTPPPETQPEPQPEPRPTAEPTQTAEPASPPTGPRQIMHKDCDALAKKYGDLVRIEETAKLSPKLTAAQRQTADANIAKGAATLAERFAAGCSQSLVGGFTEEEALQCAMRAKSLALFDQCMNGPPAAPPESAK